MKSEVRCPHLSQQGFSLIELVICVAIVSVLASIAIPNYQEYVEKARQTEAKMSLGAMYTVEQAFFADQSAYTMCLWQAGYQPSADAPRYYLTGSYGGGWIYGGVSTWSYDYPSNTQCSQYYIPFGTSSRDDSTFMANRWANPDMEFAEVPNVAWGVDSTFTFTLVALGSISDASIFDIWTVDQNGSVVHLQSGI